MLHNVLQMDPVLTLLNAVNVKLNTSFNKTNCVLSAPSRTNDLNRNAKFELFCLPSSGVIGKYTIYYNRLHATAIMSNRRNVERKQAIYVSDLLLQINELNGIWITSNDIIDQLLPPKNGNEGKINYFSFLNFAENSWFWYSGVGSDYISPVIAPKIQNEPNVVLDIGCHGWALVETNTDENGALREVIVNEHAEACGWDSGLTLRGSGNMRFIESARSGSGAMHFKMS